jgi:pheromone shutdown protein TraB
MEEKQAENVEQQQPATKERPTFLTVLCILSFIGVGLVVISNLVALIGGGVSKAIMESSEEVMQAMEAVEEVPVVGESVSKIVSSASTIAAINIIAALVVLVGVFMMWSLKKTGYYIYIVGEIAPVIALIVLGGLLGGFMAIFSSFIAILFIILYGLNVKHMA